MAQSRPIGETGGLNLYEFIYNSPLAFVDANGLCPCKCKTVKGGPVHGGILNGGSKPGQNQALVMDGGHAAGNQENRPQCAGEFFLGQMGGLGRPQPRRSVESGAAEHGLQLFPIYVANSQPGRMDERPGVSGRQTEGEVRGCLQEETSCLGLPY